jgi:hypothetical protein
MMLALKIADYFGFAKLRPFAEEFINHPSGAAEKVALFVTLSVAWAKSPSFFSPLRPDFRGCGKSALDMPQISKSVRIPVEGHDVSRA